MVIMKELAREKLEDGNFILKSKVTLNADYCVCSCENETLQLFSLETQSRYLQYKFPSAIFDFDLSIQTHNK